MSTLVDSLVASTSRPLALRCRADLEARQQTYQGQAYWVVKDPVALRYFRFEPEEYFVLQCLDGKATLDELQEQFARQFPPQRIQLRELTQAIGRLHASGLVVADAGGQGATLKARRDEREAAEKWAFWSNPLSLRFPGFDPDAFLTWLDGWAGWLFTLPALVGCLLLVAAALALVTIEFETFRARLPGFGEFFGPHNWFLLLIVLGGTKVLHELGHGLSCKRLGGECHEMGVMLLVGAPCLYCNVTDSWMLPDKWRRMAIGAAGMYVEVVLAAGATFIWWFTNPGLLHYLALNVMFVCSVSTLVFNANPLLKYDGYYILADWLEIPNLRSKADALLQRLLGEWLLGIDPPPSPLLPREQQVLFVLYSLAAGVYRWVVTLSILWMLNGVLEPYGLKILGQLLALASIYALLVAPLWQLWQFLQIPGRMDQVNPLRVWTIVGVAAGLLVAASAIPLPYSIVAGLRVEPRDAPAVYVTVAGELRELRVRPGQQVEAGQVLAVLTNPDVELAIARLSGEKAQLEAKLESIRRRALTDASAALQQAQIEESLATLADQLRRREEDRRRLTLTAPVAGTVLPPERKPAPATRDGRLAPWTGLPLEERNLGAFFEAGVLVCRIGDPTRLQAAIAIDQSEIEFLRAGQSVALQLDPLPGQEFGSTLSEVARSELKVAPLTLAVKAGGPIPTRTDDHGLERPLGVVYQASAPIDNTDRLIHLGARGQAQIHAGYRTLAERAWRYACETFNFRL